ncbi:MAG: ATP-dependent nuclease, partial [Promethearchaeota archaeon]
MKIKELLIRNFRGIKELNVKFNNLTILIGKNGVGKSSILHALNFFKDSNYKLKIEDFFMKDLSKNIEVSISFSDLSPSEKELFHHYIQNKELKVIKIAKGDIETNNPNASQKYYGLKFQHRPFLEIRNTKSKTEKKEKYHALIENEKYNTLPKIGRSSADFIEKHLTEWEQEHEDELELIIDDGQFFGWKEVASGNLSKSMRFFFIPAIHEYSEEEKAKKSTYLNEILELTINKNSSESEELSLFKENSIEKYKQLISEEN